MKKITTSKLLTWTITIFFMICVLIVEFVQVKYNINTFNLLSYILPLESIIILSYFGKSSMEFYQRIKSGVDTVNSTLQNTVLPSETSNQESNIQG